MPLLPFAPLAPLDEFVPPVPSTVSAAQATADPSTATTANIERALFIDEYLQREDDLDALLRATITSRAALALLE
ncbi:MAG TPA: hypothetical protein VM925_26875 [Labilithrix sp.]|nr:hypothetical protein [Labilithrix sp.]